MAFSPYIATTVTYNDSSGSVNTSSSTTWDEPSFKYYYVKSGWTVNYPTVNKEPPKKHPVELF